MRGLLPSLPWKGRIQARQGPLNDPGTIFSFFQLKILADIGTCLPNRRQAYDKSIVMSLVMQLFHSQHCQL